MAQKIMAAQKSHNVSSVSWRHRKAHDIIHSELKDLRIGEANDVNPSLKMREDEMRCPNSSG